MDGMEGPSRGSEWVFCETNLWIGKKEPCSMNKILQLWCFAGAKDFVDGNPAG